MSDQKIEMEISQGVFDAFKNSAVEFTPDEYLEMQGWQVAGMVLSNIALHYRSMAASDDKFDHLATSDREFFCDMRDVAETFMRDIVKSHEAAMKRIYEKRGQQMPILPGERD